MKPLLLILLPWLALAAPDPVMAGVPGPSLPGPVPRRRPVAVTPTPAAPAPAVPPSLPPPSDAVLTAAAAPSPSSPATPGPAAAPDPATAGRTNKPAALAMRGAVSITGEGGFEYDGETGRVIYKTKVRVLDPETDPRTIIECDWLTTILPPPGGTMGELVALTNVVIRIKDEKGMQVATGNRAVYNPTNDIVTIEGSPPVVEMHTGTLYGDERVIYNRQSNRFEAPGKFRIVSRPGGPLPFPGVAATNAPPRPVVPKPNP